MEKIDNMERSESVYQNPNAIEYFKKHEEMHSKKPQKKAPEKKPKKEKKKKVLIIYSGGTFGMQLQKNGQLSIKNTDSLKTKLKQIPDFYDKKQTYLSDKDFMISPKILNVRLHYKIHQFKKLIDSSDSNPSFILQMLKIIKQNYNLYDAFIIIHGTDTLEYSGSALSFLIKNPKKPILLTGSQIPLSIVRNDAHRNLLGCFRVICKLIR